MPTTTIKTTAFGETFFVRTDLAQASAPVQISWDGAEWLPTPYQCADARHTIRGLEALGNRLGAEAFDTSSEDFWDASDNWTRV